MSAQQMLSARTPREVEPAPRTTLELLRAADPRRLMTVGVILVVAVLSLVPTVYLIIGAFSDGDDYTLQGFRDAYFDNPQMGQLIANSFQFAGGAAFLSMVLGTTLAFLYARTDVAFKPLIFASSVMPLLVPPLHYAISWMILAGPSNGILTSLPGLGFLDIYSMWGMIWVQGILFTPLAFLMMSAALVGMDPSLEESARASGATWPQVFRRVTGPLLRPALIGAALLMFVQMIDSFEIPALIGLRERKFVFTSQIYYALQQGGNSTEAGALAIGLLLIAIVSLLLARLAMKGGVKATITGKAFRPQQIPLRGFRPVAGVFVLVYTLVAFVLPLSALLYTSLLPYYQAPSGQALEAMSFDNYTALREVGGLLTSVKNSLIVSSLSATGVMVLTVTTALLMMRRLGRGTQRLLDGLLFVPVVMPGIILGLATSYIFLRVDLPVYGTLWIFVIAFLSRYMPWGSRFSQAAVGQVAVELEDAALVGGATKFQAFRRILLPLVFSGVLAGWIYVFVLSFREVSAAILLYSPDSQVISVLMWQMANSGDLPTLAALGILLISFLSVVILVVRRLGGEITMQR
jgi:iron(III) transport system permease protein